MGGRLQRVKEKVQGLRPRLTSAYVTYFHLPDRIGRRFDVPSNYRFKLASDIADPDMAFAPRWQRRLAAGPMARGEWFCLLAFDDDLGGTKVGHVWVTTATSIGLGNGMLNVRLRPDEGYVWDLYIEPEHRKLKLGNAMGQVLVDTFIEQDIKYGYTHVLCDNGPSVMWHHMFGLNGSQTVNCVHIGERYWWKVPFSACPRFGPLSRHGRHDTDPPPDLLGFGLLPPEWARSEPNAPVTD